MTAPEARADGLELDRIAAHVEMITGSHQRAWIKRGSLLVLPGNTTHHMAWSWERNIRSAGIRCWLEPEALVVDPVWCPEGASQAERERLANEVATRERIRCEGDRHLRSRAQLLAARARDRALRSTYAKLSEISGIGKGS